VTANNGDKILSNQRPNDINEAVSTYFDLYSHIGSLHSYKYKLGIEKVQACTR